MKSTVYILFGCIEQSDYVDSFGEEAGDRENVIGVYSTEKKAIAERAKLEADGCSSDYYRIEAHTIM